MPTTNIPSLKKLVQKRQRASVKAFIIFILLMFLPIRNVGYLSRTATEYNTVMCYPSGKHSHHPDPLNILQENSY